MRNLELISNEDSARRELALIFFSEIEDENYIQEYAIITCAIRHALKGVKREFLLETIGVLCEEYNKNL